MKLIKTVGRNTDHIKNDVDIGHYMWLNFASRKQLQVYDQGEIDGKPCYFIENIGKNEVVIVSEDGKDFEFLAPYGQDYYGKVWYHSSFVIHEIAGIPAQHANGDKEKCLITLKVNI